MRPGVTAILVARDASRSLERTIAALEGSTRIPDRVVMVNLASKDSTLEVMREAEPDILLTLETDTTFGAAVAEAVAVLEEQELQSEGDWLWLLSADNAPEHDALEQLLATAERNPSLEVTGPKLVRSDDAATLVEFGQSMLQNGESLRLREDELDQGQFDEESDVLGVAAGGMLVRREPWLALDGFDPGLPAVDDALDFCTRVWLAGGRVLLTPSARVACDPGAPGTAAMNPGMSASAVEAARDTARVHRSLTKTPVAAFAILRVLLIPIALLKGIWHLVRKRPRRVIAELRSAGRVTFGATGAARSRAQFAKTRTEPWTVIEPLLVSAEENQKTLGLQREQLRALTHEERERYSLVGSGGLWVLLVSTLLGVALSLPLLGQSTLSGGGLLPLADSVGTLWGRTGYGVRDVGDGAFGVADPFTYVLAVLGTVTFWYPSLSIVLLWLFALPLAAMGAWMLVARLTTRPGLRAFAAFGWMLAPPLLVALAEGRVAAVIAHLVLPWLIFSALSASRNWSRAAATGLLAAVAIASAPLLAVPLAVVWLIWTVTGGRGVLQRLLTAVPTLVLFAPLAVAQWNRGRPLALFADPGVPLASTAPEAWQLLLGFPSSLVHDPSWAGGLLDSFPASPIVAAVLLAPLFLLALLAPGSRTWRAALFGLQLVVLGFATAAAAIRFGFAHVGVESITLWPGSAQSLMWLGVLIAAVAMLGALRRRSAHVLAGIALAGVILIAALPATAVLRGDSLIGAGDGRSLPAIVDAQGRASDEVGTLVIVPLASGAVEVRLERGTGDSLDSQSTLRTTSVGFSAGDQRLAELAVNFASDSLFRPTEELHALGISYLLVPEGASDAATMQGRLVSSLDANPGLRPAGATEFGSLWQVVGPTLEPTDPNVAGPLDTANTGTALGRSMLIVQGVLLALTLLTALPTGGLGARAADLRRRETTTAPPWYDLDGSNAVGDARRLRRDVTSLTVDDFAEDDDDVLGTGTRGGDHEAR
ncbi:glycosyltransferase [Pseudoclavibacter helvolus]|uniref:glycosyltransferase n=1 Tax=Pseudoclavibacter helvolus TaxID=255205 RepID=UPI003C7883A7